MSTEAERKAEQNQANKSRLARYRAAQTRYVVGYIEIDGLINVKRFGAGQ